MKTRWRHGNSVRLLENGDDYFPRAFEAIRRARRRVVVETFILFEDAVGEQLREALVAAARSGARIDLIVDGYGSPSLSRRYLDALLDADVRVHVFDPRRRVLGFRTNLFRRLHRKIVAVDGRIAFVGGINFAEDQCSDHGDDAKQDYALEIEGPLAEDILHSSEALVANRRDEPDRTAQKDSGAAEGPRLAFVTRDNSRHRNDIERHYREAIKSARRRVFIANAYFLPGYRLLRELRDAARRGVDVRLILPGRSDEPAVATASRSLSRYLLPAGVRIYEYCARPLHGKVAVVDDEWATVGSSNLDPLSLWFNLEANVVALDRELNATLHDQLERLAATQCRRVEDDRPAARWSLRPLLGVILFHFLRYFPRFARSSAGKRSPVLEVTEDSPRLGDAYQVSSPDRSMPSAERRKRA